MISFKNKEKNLDKIIESVMAKNFGSTIEEKVNKTEEKQVDIKPEVQKYDERGRKIDDISADSKIIEDTEEDSLEQTIEFGILDFNKPSIYTNKKWTIEDDKAGAFFIYNANEDLMWSKIYLRDKETQEIVWVSPLRYLPEQIKIDNCKSRVVYMSSKALLTEHLKDINSKYELFINDDEENIVDFVINDIRNEFEDIIVKYEKNQINYLINHVLNYPNYEISRKDSASINKKCDSDIIIEKIDDKYSILLNKPENVINKIIFLRDESNNIYNDFVDDLNSIILSLEEKMNIRYGTTNEEFNNLSKLIITDENIEVNGLENVTIMNRKDVIACALNEDEVLIDKCEKYTNIMIYDEDKILTICLENVCNDDIEVLRAIVKNKKIVMTGVTDEDNDDLEKIYSLSELICNN